MKMKMKNRTHKYNINKPRSRHGHKYIKYEKMSQHDDTYMYSVRPKQHSKLKSWKR